MFSLRGLMAVNSVLKPIFSALAIDSSVVPEVEHCFLNLINSLQLCNINRVNSKLLFSKKEYLTHFEQFIQTKNSNQSQLKNICNHAFDI